MKNFQIFALVAARVAAGVLFFYAGWEKIINPAWSAAGYLSGAKDFHALYAWFASAGVLSFVNFVNKWGLLLLGVALILGAFVRLASGLGIALMALYYLPLAWPFVDANSFIVDEHILLIALLLIFIAWRAGHVWGVDGYWARRKSYRRLGWCRALLG